MSSIHRYEPTTPRPEQQEGEDFSAYWKRRRKWEVDQGYSCRRCGAIATRALTDFYVGYPRLCKSCHNLDTNESHVSSSTYIRCPKCGRSWNAFEHEDYGLLQEGEHTTMCGDCDDFEFTVETRVSYEFKSPPLIKEEEKEDEDGEEDDEV
jgi:hypothetical protein